MQNDELIAVRPCESYRRRNRTLFYWTYHGQRLRHASSEAHFVFGRYVISASMELVSAWVVCFASSLNFYCILFSPFLFFHEGHVRALTVFLWGTGRKWGSGDEKVDHTRLWSDWFLRLLAVGWGRGWGRCRFDQTYRMIELVVERVELLRLDWKRWSTVGWAKNGWLLCSLWRRWRRGGCTSGRMPVRTGISTILWT